MFTKKNLMYLIMLILLDQITKFLAFKFLYHSYNINNILILSIHLNKGISYNIFDGMPSIFLISISLFLLILIYKFFIHNNIYIIKKSKYLSCSFLLFFSGAISNIFDRIIYGKVIDFLLIKFGYLSTNIFNFADMYIVFSILLFLLKKEENICLK